ncbi:MAG TPA: ATP-binding protein [Vicinamibacterales bacterium]|nr:ATP-binding protein [Vicinamibacterales bacterium]
MTETSLIERLAALPSLAAMPRAQLQWLAAHGAIRRFEPGEVMFPKAQPIADLYVVLAGRFSISVSRGGVARKVKEWRAGGLTGQLPYSRMTSTPGETLADEPVELLRIPAADVPDMTRACYEFTALCVHEMVDRARQFKSDDLQREKMASLGLLAAGLAHELNNPSSAVARSARELEGCRAEAIAASRDLGAAGLSDEQRSALHTLEGAAAQRPAQPHAPLAQSDREDAIAGWLDAHGVDAGLAEAFANTAVTVVHLDAAASALTGPALPVALRYVAADAAARRLTAEIESAASRIHSLVAAVKTHTYMDRAPVAEPVDVEANLANTLTLIGSRARAKAVTLTLDVSPDLPRPWGVAGELNQVWLNLMSNAIDAAPEQGHVIVTAMPGRDSVIVSVVDDGHGIPEEHRDRIFEPFFTTKPPGEGTGLGLDIVQSIVRSHDGSIEVNSAPGRTEFRVCLPVAR